MWDGQRATCCVRKCGQVRPDPTCASRSLRSNDRSRPAVCRHRPDDVPLGSQAGCGERCIGSSGERRPCDLSPVADSSCRGPPLPEARLTIRAGGRRHLARCRLRPGEADPAAVERRPRRRRLSEMLESRHRECSRLTGRPRSPAGARDETAEDTMTTTPGDATGKPPRQAARRRPGHLAGGARGTAGPREGAHP